MREFSPLIFVITLVMAVPSPDDQWRCYILQSQKVMLRQTSHQLHFCLEGKVELLHPGLRLIDPKG